MIGSGSHRVFQEYSLARYLRRRNLDPTAFPSSVRALYDEIEDLD